MFRKFLKSKIHRATVTQADLDYEGSLTLPPDLMRAANIAPYEAVVVWNITRGSRLETYAIEGVEGDRDICANGAAAHHIRPGDMVIVATFLYLMNDVADARTHDRESYSSMLRTRLRISGKRLLVLDVEERR